MNAMVPNLRSQIGDAVEVACSRAAGSDVPAAGVASPPDVIAQAASGACAANLDRPAAAVEMDCID